MYCSAMYDVCYPDISGVATVVLNFPLFSYSFSFSFPRLSSLFLSSTGLSLSYPLPALTLVFVSTSDLKKRGAPDGVNG